MSRSALRLTGLLLPALAVATLAMLYVGRALPVGLGELIFAASSGRSLEIYRMDVERRLMQAITDNDFTDFAPDWSPDGERIAFVSDRDGNREIYVMDALGRDVRRLTQHPDTDFAPVWSPDGRQIAFVSERYGLTELMLAGVESGRLTRLTRNDSLDISPAWSPDGTRLAFVSDRDQRWDANIYVMTLATGAVEILQATPGDDLGPAWSPDGRYLIYTSDFGNMAIFLANLETGRVVPLFSNNFTGFDTPAWSRDGRYITYSATSGNSQMSLFMVDVQCLLRNDTCPSTVHQVTGQAALMINPRWKP